MNLLCQTRVNPQMVPPCALEKGVVSPIVMHLHVGIAPRLPNDPLGGPTVMEEEISMGGTVIGKLNAINCISFEGLPSSEYNPLLLPHPLGCQATEVILSALHQDDI